MSDFAKIVNATDGAQVLFYKSTNSSNGKPQLRQVTEFEGMFAEVNLDFKDVDEGWAGLDRAFAEAGLKQADQVRETIKDLFADGPEQARAQTPGASA